MYFYYKKGLFSNPPFFFLALFLPLSLILYSFIPLSSRTFSTHILYKDTPLLLLIFIVHTPFILPLHLISWRFLYLCHHTSNPLLPSLPTLWVSILKWAERLEKAALGSFIKVRASPLFGLTTREPAHCSFSSSHNRNQPFEQSTSGCKV